MTDILDQLRHCRNNRPVPSEVIDDAIAELERLRALVPQPEAVRERKGCPHCGGKVGYDNADDRSGGQWFYCTECGKDLEAMFARRTPDQTRAVLERAIEEHKRINADIGLDEPEAFWAMRTRLQRELAALQAEPQDVKGS